MANESYWINTRMVSRFDYEQKNVTLAI